MPTITLMRRSPFVVLGILFILMLLMPHRVWAMSFAGLGILLLATWGWIRLLAQGLSAERHLHARWVGVGDVLRERFELHNSSGLPCPWVEIVDESTVPGYTAVGVRSLAPQQRVRWDNRAVCTRRGRYRIGPWSLHIADPFGFFEAVIHYDDAQEIVIHPPIHVNIPLEPPSGFGRGQSRRQRKSWRSANNVSSTRAYQPGDPIKHIHWRSSARRVSQPRNPLIVKQFDRDTSGDVWLLIDMQRDVQLGSGLDGTEEHAILLAASLANAAQRDQRAVGLAAYGSTPFLLPPQQGAGQSWRILRALALLSADSTLPLKRTLTDLARNVRRDSAVLIITPNLSADWLPQLFAFQRAGVAVSIALFDRKTFDETASGSADALKQELAAFNIDTVILPRGAVGRPNNPLPDTGESEFVITPMGRAVRRIRIEE